MRLFILRHGETIQNAQGIVQGHAPGELSDQGRSQADKTGRNLADTHFDKIYCSDLNRCKQTLEIIEKVRHSETPVEYTERLRERSFGEWEGFPGSSFDWTGIEKSRDNKPPGGESLNEHHSRSVDFVNSLLPAHKKDQLLLVTHGGVIRLLVANYYKVPEHNAFNALNTRNAGYIVLDVTEPLGFTLLE